MHKQNPYTQLWTLGNFITAFLVFTIIYGLYLNFWLSNWIAMFLFVISVFALSYWLYKNLIYALIIAMLLTEIFWTLLFWPLNSLTIGAIMLIVYYTLWEIRYKRKIYLNLVFAGGLIILLLLTSRWSIN